MGLNAVGINIGTIGGATIAGLGLGLGGYEGLALVMVLMASASALALLFARRSLGTGRAAVVAV
jgi:hypothetical protein